ncbi:orotidine-5'-phosphate decarboxylase [Agromyces sp. SYSU T00194]|uniref:orotidine-5'-phosphate decarboxylase n=1 Tax=Agromyces chitinivorans TaxID=3158560 RepID=UPI003395D639
MASFGARLGESFDRFGRLCVGIDPHAGLLDAWGLPASGAGVREFGLRVVDAMAGRVGICKPQVAFFERFGSAGIAGLERVLAEARGAGILVIADAKRGDIDTTMDAYARAWLEPGSPLEADALTVNPYQGLGNLAPTHRLAQQHEKGLFVLAATSNPEAAAIQRSVLQQGSREGSTVAAAICSGVAAWNAEEPEAAQQPFGSTGVVIGATVDLRAAGIDPDDTGTPRTPILAPGFGAQGAALSDLGDTFGALAAGVIANESRSILSAGPDGIRDAIARRAEATAVARG